ncbi:MAG: hypothetical protein JSS53_09500 [Proteobacteria bacterium]|nr:hypothetical protein [Pseudomonadota bacterium]
MNSFHESESQKGLLVFSEFLNDLLTLKENVGYYKNSIVFPMCDVWRTRHSKALIV